MATVILVRHGRTTANATGILAGRALGVRLDEIGQEQAALAGTRLATVPLVGVVSSPLERCRQTASYLVNGLKIDPARIRITVASSHGPIESLGESQQPAGSDLGSAEPPASPDTPVSSAPARRRTAAKTPRQGGSARTLKAKFPGRCVCGRSYAAGETIAKNDQGWGHPECRAEASGNA